MATGASTYTAGFQDASNAGITVTAAASSGGIGFGISCKFCTRVSSASFSSRAGGEAALRVPMGCTVSICARLCYLFLWKSLAKPQLTLHLGVRNASFITCLRAPGECGGGAVVGSARRALTGQTGQGEAPFSENNYFTIWERCQIN